MGQILSSKSFKFILPAVSSIVVICTSVVLYLTHHTPGFVHADPTIFLSDTFSNSTLNGWGTPNVGPTYVIVGNSSSFSTNSNTGLITTVAGNSREITANISQADVNIVTELTINTLPIGNNALVTIGSRRTSLTSAYRGKFSVTPASAVTVQIAKLSGSTSELNMTGLTTVGGLTVTAQSKYMLRYQSVGTNPTNLRMKIWDAAGAEPTSWHLEYIDVDDIESAGEITIRAFTHSSITNTPIVYAFDNLLVSNDLFSPTPVASPSPSPTPEPVNGEVVRDSFGSDVADGWGNTEYGGAYTIPAHPTSFSKLDGIGRMSLAAGNSRDVLLNEVSVREFDLRFRSRINKVPVGANLSVLALLHRTDDSNQYRVEFNYTPTGAITVIASKNIGSTSKVNIGSTTSIPNLLYSPDSWYWFRVQVQSTNPTLIRVMVWPDGTEEPTSWPYFQLDSTQELQATGSIGFKATASSSITNATTEDPITVDFDDLTVSEIILPALVNSTGTCESPYSADGVWNQKITDSTPYHLGTQSYFRQDTSLAQDFAPLALFYDEDSGKYVSLSSDTSQYTYPVYYVDNSTPLQTVTFNGYFSDVFDTNNDGYEDTTIRSRDPDYNNGLQYEIQVPIPTIPRASKGSDGQIIIINTDTNEEWAFWRVDKNGDGIGDYADASIGDDSWVAHNGKYWAVNGYRYKTTYRGSPPSAINDGSDDWSLRQFGSRGAGVPYLAGLVRPCELERGYIDHAIAFGYPKPSSDFTYPATKSDGTGGSVFDSIPTKNLPEGSRLQLDPRITDEEIEAWGCYGACFVIAKAMQEYGVILIDISGSYKIIAEDDKTAQWSTRHPSAIITRSAVEPIPPTALRLLEFTHPLNQLVVNVTPIPTPIMAESTITPPALQVITSPTLSPSMPSATLTPTVPFSTSVPVNNALITSQLTTIPPINTPIPTLLTETSTQIPKTEMRTTSQNSTATDNIPLPYFIIPVAIAVGALILFAKIIVLKKK
jgi:hypothetical protein